MKESKVKIVLKRMGIREILKSQMMMDALKSEAVKHGEIEDGFVGLYRCNVSIKENKDDD